MGILSAHAQSKTAFSVPENAVDQLENVKETTKSIADPKVQSSKVQAEVRPEINRLLVIAADDFLRITKDGRPTKAAYLRCLDRDLARIYPLMTNVQDRQQVAIFFQELMEIVGLTSSEGRLAAFAASTATEQ